MYGIFTYIWLIFMENVGKYTIHGSYMGNIFIGESDCCSDVQALLTLPKNHPGVLHQYLLLSPYEGGQG